jgi:hypothetical protein
MWDLRVRVSYFEADLRVRVSYFGLTYESESAILGRPASQSQLFWMSKSHLRVRVSYFAVAPASQSQLFCSGTCESESAILQGPGAGSDAA